MAASESTTIPRARGMRAPPLPTPTRESLADRDPQPQPQPSPQSRTQGTRGEGATTSPTPPAAKPRRLTVGSSYQESHKPSAAFSTTPAKPVPNVRLCGAWLRNAGFTIGQRIQVEVSEGWLTIMPAD
jgi:hypothetical protein